MQSRKISAINIDSFVNDISPIITENPVAISVEINQYNSNLARIFGKSCTTCYQRDNYSPQLHRGIPKK